ncbi:hypothetical protein CF77_gp26 [Oenococcus phage phi9805]|uniref:Uncharacterized protein n=1 Tax=Oenococcus phage phi9805 TaxID=1435411 RepID=V9QJ97_9CAUD|nr:hypothetical protein [Oenococcus oeni]YP_009005185.1 hypothetical protein CF77_gp26 [Oenococcus phage phi9805]AHC30339.1 hypothetical protein [Oenococcus phage phi9805]KGH60289.1 hypothetical protein X288_02275 [Oenococcus oeni IOEB_9805]KGH75566.1 hypothetical protein X287_04500 [Oenococcus oeni IOEB_9803]KGH78852.1 hypothetical protein X284_01995 [Oenococcus oeni IOEB_8417]
MNDTEQIQSLITRLGIGKELATDFYNDGVAQVLDYTNRKKLVGNMPVYAKKLAIIAFNHNGTEGETERVEGGVTNGFEAGIPLSIRQSLAKYRRAVIGELP